MVRIPEEYQEVEYIESSIGTYINTNIIPNDNMRIYLEGITKEEINSAGFFFGSRTGANYAAKNKFWGLTYKNSYDYGFMGDANIKITNAQKNQHFIFDFNFNQSHDMKINDITVTPKTGIENSYMYPIFLFGVNSSGRLDSQQQTLIIKKFVIYSNYQDAQPSLYFIPCYRKSDGEIGMYDIVSKQFFTNSGTGTFLKGHNVYYDDVNLLEQRRKILLNTPHLETVSNNIVTFNTDMNVSLKDCKIYFNPIQEGEGDPSPDNVRPIHGWDGITIYHTGKNFFPIESGMRGGQADILLKANQIYTGSVKGPATPYIWLTYIDDTSSPLIWLNPVNESERSYKSFQPILDTKKVRFFLGGQMVQEMMIEKGNVIPKNFESYQSQTPINIPFPQTIYGGYVDLVKGEVVDTWVNRAMSELDPIKTSGSGSWKHRYDTLSVWITGGGYESNTSLMDKAYCDMLARGTPTSNNIYTVYASRFSMYDDTVDTATAFKEKWTNCHFVYPVLERYYKTYTLTPQTIKALKGINNIWSDANGDIEVKLWKH